MAQQRNDFPFRGRLEISVFVEDIVIGQECLMDDGFYFPLVQDPGCIEEILPFGIWVTGRSANDRRHTVCVLPDPVHRGLTLTDEIIEFKEVPWRISANTKFREHGKICSGFFRTLQCGKDQIHISIEISNMIVLLRNKDFHGSKFGIHRHKSDGFHGTADILADVNR
jgi:hypothetical protein